jgi:hypothetical protein
MRPCWRHCQEHERRQSDDERRFLASPASIDFERAARNRITVAAAVILLVFTFVMLGA